ncbi:MAG: protein phosphatase 2C domain-containing protein [Nocardioides sp.]|uniref:PP2C family protein-serine/threonine phosphatase n=1 Tax=Nocardioides sp. TaxID=35761 RepID=UPI000C98B181|nr:protein phosphatase 2C domain-containing protein [Nocardioides sp.]MAS56328.1 protein phosphatase [Pimelobacter sp.]MDE0776253.1 protein phosphatase 2C domain-containing protein [Nocardioides sp.]
MLQFRTAAASHVGLVRSHNEDSGLSGPSLVVVADGMGGAAAGEVASATAVRVAEDALRGPRDLAPADVLEQVVDRARAEIHEAVLADPSLAGMGTTFTAVHTDGTRTAIAHLGDSRAYRWRSQVLEQVTHDHTLVQTMVDAGRLSPAQARRSAHRHIVMRSLGGGGLSEPDLGELEVAPGDRLLVCSDGLSDLVDDTALALILAVPDAATVVELLVAAALEAGGVDNVTCLVVDVVDGPAAQAGPVERWGAVAELGAGLLPGLRRS